MVQEPGNSALIGNRWVWHTCGIVAALFIAHLVLASFVHAVPVPRVSATTFIVMYLSSLLLSVIAGSKGSRWWFVVTAGLVGTVILIWVAEYYFER